jgi:hypothetical protein
MVLRQMRMCEPSHKEVSAFETRLIDISAPS